MKRDYFTNQFIEKRPKTLFDDGFLTKYFSEDPIFFSFSIFFDMDCPLLNPASNNQLESAERYFLNQDDDIRAGYVVELRERIKNLVSNHQYYLQSITGLNLFYAKETVDGSDIDIEIKTMETLDMRISKIKELYNRISYDYNNKKEILPDNLCWINLKITVSDGRKLAKWINDEFVDITPSLDTLCFKLKKTKFNFSAGHDYLETINNEEFEVGTNSLSFKGGRGSVEESRIGLTEMLNNQKEVINSINQNVRDSSEEVDLIPKRSEEIIEKKSLKDQLKEFVSEKVEDIKDQAKTAYANRGAYLDVLEDFGRKKLLSLKNQASSTVYQEMQRLISQAELSTGLRDVNNPVFQSNNFIDILRNSLSSGRIEFSENKDLEKKILNQEKLTKEDKGNLFEELFKLGGGL